MRDGGGVHADHRAAQDLTARRELQKVLGTRVHLDLAVRVRRGWRADESLLDRLGIE